jgi:limonene-1,2-epoxide hydrolase
MAEQTAQNTRTIEVFLNALADEDFETASAALADYFDFYDMLKATARGLAALVVPSLRASF